VSLGSDLYGAFPRWASLFFLFSGEAFFSGHHHTPTHSTPVPRADTPTQTGRDQGCAQTRLAARRALLFRFLTDLLTPPTGAPVCASRIPGCAPSRSRCISDAHADTHHQALHATYKTNSGSPPHCGAVGRCAPPTPHTYLAMAVSRSAGESLKYLMYALKKPVRMPPIILASESPLCLRRRPRPAGQAGCPFQTQTRHLWAQLHVHVSYDVPPQAPQCGWRQRRTTIRPRAMRRPLRVGRGRGGPGRIILQYLNSAGAWGGEGPA
jgi:hypothetical protein